MNNIARSKKEWMKEQIDRMDENEHLQLFTIIRKYTDQFTKTQNGILISTDGLDDMCLTEVEKYIHFSIDQHKRMEDDMKTRKNYERMIHE